MHAALDAKTSPATRPLQAMAQVAIAVQFERALERLWSTAATSIPDWLPMRFIHWLPTAYEVALTFQSEAKGRSNIYLALLDYHDRGAGEYGVYVGMSKYSPLQRFDQHKAGIRAAGSVLKRGIEVLTGPTLHLQYIKRSEAERIESQLAEALTAAGPIRKPEPVSRSRSTATRSAWAQRKGLLSWAFTEVWSIQYSPRTRVRSSIKATSP